MVYTDGTCMKHDKRWRSKLEWLANIFRNKKTPEIRGSGLKIEEFVGAFMNLVCTCGQDGARKPQLKEINDELWRNVTEDDFKAGIDKLKNYSVDPEMKTVAQDLLKSLYKRCVLHEHSFEAGIKSAYRLTYLVSQIIWNDFSLLNRYVAELVRRQPKVQTFELVELPVERMDAFPLQHFNAENRCEVTLRKKTKKDGNEIVSGSVKKVVDVAADLDEIVRKIRQLATQIQDNQMEVDSSASTSQTTGGQVPQASNVTQPFIPQHSTQAFVPQIQQTTSSSQTSDPAAQSHMEMETQSDETQSDICLVHSPTWMSTYQFVLNQCLIRNILTADKSQEFTQEVCTCNDTQGNAKISQYFSGQLDIQTKLRRVKEELSSWRNCIIVIQKLIWEMDNEQQAGTWQSLLKFVHQFMDLLSSDRNGAPNTLFGNK